MRSAYPLAIKITQAAVPAIGVAFTASEMNLSLSADFCYLDYNATVSVRSFVVSRRVHSFHSSGTNVPTCAPISDHIAPKWIFWQSINSKCCGPGNYVPCSNSMALAMIINHAHVLFFAASKQKLPSKQPLTKLPFFSAAIPMKSFSPAEEVKAPTMPFVVFARCEIRSTQVHCSSSPFCSHPGCHIVTTAIEHYVVPKNCAQFFEPAGHSVTVVGVLSNGLVDLEAFTAALTPETRLVSVMLAQNETGIVQPIREICDAAHQVGAFVHVDACQAAGKIPINVSDLGADLLSIAGHKFSGPPGTGALFVRRGLQIQPLIVGAMQQGGRRAGTEAVMSYAAMGVACSEAQKWLGGNGPFFQLGIRGRVIQFMKKWCKDNGVAVVFHGEGSPVVPTVSARDTLCVDSVVCH